MSDCRKTYKQKDQLDYHIKQNHPKLHAAIDTTLDKQGKQPSDIDNEPDKEKTKIRFPCPQEGCLRSFAFQWRLDYHQLIKHPERVRDYEVFLVEPGQPPDPSHHRCPIAGCGKVYTEYGYLFAHQQDAGHIPWMQAPKSKHQQADEAEQP